MTMKRLTAILISTGAGITLLAAGTAAGAAITGSRTYAHHGRHVITVTLSDQVDGSVLATTG